MQSSEEFQLPPRRNAIEVAKQAGGISVYDAEAVDQVLANIIAARTMLPCGDGGVPDRPKLELTGNVRGGVMSYLDHQRLVDAYADRMEALLRTSEAKVERLTDLVRYMRSELHSADLISDEEFAALLADSEGGKRVVRLESYDELRRTFEAKVEGLEKERSLIESNWLLWGRKLLRRWQSQRPLHDLMEKELPHLLEISSHPTDILRGAAPRVEDGGKDAL